MLSIGTKALIACIAIVMGSSCMSSDCKGVPTGFFRMPSDQRWAEFQKFDFETQYNTYICGQQRVEPPDVQLALIFARNGGTIVKPLESKLSETNDDRTIQNIVYLFDIMNSIGAYNVASNRPLMEILSRKLTAIRDPTVNVIAQYSLLNISSKFEDVKSCCGTPAARSSSKPRE